jgi:hypothetical protein
MAKVQAGRELNREREHYQYTDFAEDVCYAQFSRSKPVFIETPSAQGAESGKSGFGLMYVA